MPSPADDGTSAQRGMNRHELPVRRLLAYAKINLGLEIVGRRPDGFHEIVSVTQTISLADEISLVPDSRLQVEMNPPLAAGETNLAYRAATALAQATGQTPTGRLRIEKRIPLAAGLGGGSSNAAATLVLLDQLWGTDLGHERLGAIAAELGSDVPLFLHGGASLIRGRGETVEPIPGPAPCWLVLVCPAISPPDKTRALYQALRPDEWSDGAATLALADRLRAGRPILEEPLVNGFDEAANRVYPSFPTLRTRLQVLTGRAFHLTGAGPSLFVLVQDEPTAQAVARQVEVVGAPTFVAQAVSRRSK